MLEKCNFTAKKIVEVIELFDSEIAAGDEGVKTYDAAIKGTTTDKAT